MFAVLRTVLLLVASNTFMTVAWYGHLKFREKPLLLAIGASWLIALPEYAFQVPANRWGYGALSATQLKIIQEVISLSVFVVFAWLYLGETPNWRTAAAGVLIVAAVGLIRGGGNEHEAKPPEQVAPTGTAGAPALPPGPNGCPAEAAPPPRPTSPSSGA